MTVLVYSYERTTGDTNTSIYKLHLKKKNMQKNIEMFYDLTFSLNHLSFLKSTFMMDF